MNLTKEKIARLEELELAQRGRGKHYISGNSSKIEYLTALLNTFPKLLADWKRLTEENENHRAIYGELILLRSYFSDGNLEVTLHRNDVLPLLKLIEKLKRNGE
jgi:hypothetical protein